MSTQDDLRRIVEPIITAYEEATKIGQKDDDDGVIVNFHILDECFERTMATLDKEFIQDDLAHF